MAKWRRTLSKADLIEAVRDFMLKRREIDSTDQVIVLLGTPLLVDVVDAERTVDGAHV